MPILSELSRLPDSTDQIAWKGSMCAELAVVPLQEEVQSLCAGGAAGHDSALLLFPHLQTHSTNAIQVQMASTAQQNERRTYSAASCKLICHGSINTCLKSTQE